MKFQSTIVSYFEADSAEEAAGAMINELQTKFNTAETVRVIVRDVNNGIAVNCDQTADNAMARWGKMPNPLTDLIIAVEFENALKKK